jgi:MFS family permease
MALVAMGLGVLVIANDFTALNVALPAIEQDFDVDVGTAQWVINAYALTFGMVIVTGGRLADIFGRRRIFFVGSAIFAAFSLLGGAAQDIGWLIATRVGMGIGGALMWPAVLGMTFAALPASRAGLAGGIILGVAGIGNALGPLLGGLLTDELSWRWIFFLNVPIAALAVAVTAAKVHQPAPGAQERRIDYGGIASSRPGCCCCSSRSTSPRTGAGAIGV